MRIEITSGGEPTPEEIAAIVVALTPAVRSGGDEQQPRAWRRAAVLEGIGDRFAVSADDLAGLERSTGRF